MGKLFESLREGRDAVRRGKTFNGGTARATTPNGIRTALNNFAKEDEGYGAIRASILAPGK
jgi:hypothetical protein